MKKDDLNFNINTKISKDVNMDIKDLFGDKLNFIT